jgi:BirA family biotin operon repressor/biotin-[acetyl-CoA-carboxylase] ligase
MLERERVVSTQDEARALMAETDRWALVVASSQSGGRGRGGTQWLDADRAIALSVAFTPDWPTEAWGPIPLIAGLAMREALLQTFGVTVTLKWPNDLMTDQGKVGGILSEADDGSLAVGCGVNLYWSAPTIEGAAGLLPTDPGPESNVPLARLFADLLFSAIDSDPSLWDRDAYEASCSTLGEEIEWGPSGRGLAVGIAVDGGLIVETDAGTTALRSGSVHQVRPTTMPGS